ncbi:MAG: DUF4199 domain-containing protein [Flavobacteriales bacterium]|nr:MAG: DUF4199 domain-containing protein [Flavobacteriales bacterium]|tara:strand:- start:1604 stop:2125 length:522 start_codon:yes stop_codon:yes gene_type:complete
MDSKGTIKTTVLNYGLIMGGLSIAFTLMLFLMDMHYQNSSIQQWTGLLIMSGSIIFGQLNFKKINDGFISLGEGMKIGIGIVAIGSSIGILYGLFQGYVLDPETMTKAMDYAINQAIDQNPELTDDMINAIEGAFEFFSNPFLSSAIGITVSLFFGSLISLLTGLAVKKNRSA